jgi:hypothetical protein
MSEVNKQFVLAGKSIFTFEIAEYYRIQHNLKPHYTFRVDHKAATGQWNETWFVKLLTGPDNTKDYSYLGILNPETGQVRTTPKSILHNENIEVRLLNRMLALVWSDDTSVISERGFKLHHEGRCGKCGRVLTTPESCQIGIGPECLKNF